MIIRNRDITSKHLCHFCISDQDHDLMTNPMTDSMTSPRLNSWPIRWYANPWVNDQTHKWLHGWPQEWSHDWPHILITDMADKNCDVWAVSHSSNVFLWFNLTTMASIFKKPTVAAEWLYREVECWVEEDGVDRSEAKVDPERERPVAGADGSFAIIKGCSANGLGWVACAAVALQCIGAVVSK